ncbi:MAG: DNA mismatch endonuclease Vsr [Bryobacteraceae bacterium]|nr:DNA mismatch endonuclease Vsr [Bryobacteraceae bacterium]
MTDVHTPEQRSRNMAAIRCKNTTPELKVRLALHALGFRYRLHRRDLPGRPDIVLPKFNAIVFVHGCFWHMHKCPIGKPTPVTNSDFWSQKRAGNVLRDGRNRKLLNRAGWRVFTIWECQTRDALKLENAVLRVASSLLQEAL